MLSNDYRPQKFADIRGQGLSPAILQRMVDLERVPHGLLFTGPAGTGKTSAARILAAELDADLLELDAAVTGGVEDIRRLTERLRFGSQTRVVVLDEAHSISKPGFQALLKTLEEPTPGVHFVLVTTEPRGIPKTIHTRLIQFEFARVSFDEILSMLKQVVAEKEIPAEEKLLEAIADRARGSVRAALMLLEKSWFGGATTAEEFLAHLGISDTGPLLISAIASGDPSETEKVLTAQLRTARTPQVISSSLISTLRDIQVLRAGGSIEVTGEGLAARQKLAQVIGPEAAFGALSVLWQFQTMLASTEDPASDLRLACVILEKHLNVGQKIL